MIDISQIEEVLDGESCAAACLLARDPSSACTCRCGGQYHGDVLSMVAGGPTGLVGRFFHSFHEVQNCGCELVQWQGRVLESIGSGSDLYLVGIYNFTMGEPTVQKLVPLAEMMRWSFYPTSEDWHAAWEYELKVIADQHVAWHKEGVAE